MTQLDDKIEQCKRDIEVLQKNLEELEIRKSKESQPKWIAAIGNNMRLVLNLSALSTSAKIRLVNVINSTYKVSTAWISFDENGNVRASSIEECGLKIYSNTKIIFGGE